MLKNVDSLTTYTFDTCCRTLHMASRLIGVLTPVPRMMGATAVAAATASVGYYMNRTAMMEPVYSSYIASSIRHPDAPLPPSPLPTKKGLPLQLDIHADMHGDKVMLRVTQDNTTPDGYTTFSADAYLNGVKAPVSLKATVRHQNCFGHSSSKHTGGSPRRSD